MTGIMTNTCFNSHFYNSVYVLPVSNFTPVSQRNSQTFPVFKDTLPVLGNTYHFFSGIGRGTAFTRQGKFGWPDRFLPRIVPTRFSGRMTKKQIQQTATCRKQKKKRLTLNRTGGLRLQPTSGLVFRSTAFISIVLRLCPSNVWVSSMRFWFFIPTFLL